MRDDTMNQVKEQEISDGRQDGVWTVPPLRNTLFANLM
jgi:hypothetical protein